VCVCVCVRAAYSAVRVCVRTRSAQYGAVL